VLDAARGLSALKDRPETEAQVRQADCIVVARPEQVDAAGRNALLTQLAEMNARAACVLAPNGTIDPDELSGLAIFAPPGAGRKDG